MRSKRKGYEGMHHLSFLDCLHKDKCSHVTPEALTFRKMLSIPNLIIPSPFFFFFYLYLYAHLLLVLTGNGRNSLCYVFIDSSHI